MTKTAERMSTQCRIVQPTAGGGYRFDVAWIPKEHAVKGKWLQIDGREGNWQVAEAWSTKAEKWLVDNERNFTKQRSVSDIKRAPNRLSKGHMDH